MPGITQVAPPNSHEGDSSLPMHDAWAGNNGCNIWHHRSSRLFSTRNGLLIKDNFDKGVIAIVPDLPEQRPLEELDSWVRNPGQGVQNPRPRYELGVH